MSDLEEPPAKMKRYEMSSQFLEGEVEEDGQEEWLSEEILTDDDYNATAEQDQTASNIDTSQDGTMASIDNSIDHLTDSQEAIDGLNVSANGQNVSTDASTIEDNVSTTLHSVSATVQKISTTVQNIGTTISANMQNVSKTLKSVRRIGQTGRKDSKPSLNVQNTCFGIAVQGRHFVLDGTQLKANTNVAPAAQDFEESLKNMEESQHDESDFPEDLNAFLIRKKDGKLITGNPKSVPVEDKQSDIEDSPKHSDAEDDGNDTDGLLRLLGDDEGKKKKGVVDDDETDAEDFNFEGAQIKTLKLANNAVIKKYPTRKAVEEDDDITDASSDDEPLKKVTNVQRNDARSSKVNTSMVTLQQPLIQPRHANTSTPVKKYGAKRVESTRVPTRNSQRVTSFPGPGETSILGVPLKAPATTAVKTPVTTTVKTPVTTTVKTPVTTTVKTPVTTTVKTPVTTTVKTPVTTTVKTPVTAAVKTPVTATVKTPVTTTVKTPVTTTVKNPVKSAVKTPVTSSVKTPVISAVKTPVTAAVKNPVTNAVKPPAKTVVKTPIASAVKTPITTAVKTPVTTAVKTAVKTPVSSVEKVTQTPKEPFTGVRTFKYNSKNTSQHKKAANLRRKSEDEDNSDDDDYDMPLKTSVKSEKETVKQEDQDDDMPSDMESETDEESLYDELPSSEDESLSEWFTLDIRAERAGDYIPLLGEKAEELLLEEKNRVAIRLKNLRKSLSAMTETSKEQADKLRIATAELAELDTQIKAA